MAAPNATAAPAATQTQSAVPDGLDAVFARIDQAAANAVAPIAAKQAELEQRLTQALAPTSKASTLFGGGAPSIRQGEDPLSSRGFSYHKAYGVRANRLSADKAKTEVDFCQKFGAMYRQAGFAPEGDNSMLVPLSSMAISGIDPALGNEFRQMARQGLVGFDPTEVSWQRQRAAAIGNQTMVQALSQYDDTGFAGMLGPTQHGEMIELLRAVEMFSQAGATEMSLPPNGRLKLDSQTGASTAYWVGENAAITASAPTSGSVDLMAKKLATLVKIPNELLLYGGPSTEVFFRNEMARTMGIAFDTAQFGAVGSTTTPKGLINYSGINTVVATTVATDGNTFEPKDITRMLAGEWSWLVRPNMWANINNRRAGGYAAGDGPFLFPINRGDIANGAGRTMAGHKVITSTSVLKTRAKGSSSVLTCIVGGIFRHWLIGRVGAMEFASTATGDTAFQNDQTWLRVIQHCDAAPRYSNAFALCDTLDETLPA